MRQLSILFALFLVGMGCEQSPSGQQASSTPVANPLKTPTKIEAKPPQVAKAKLSEKSATISATGMNLRVSEPSFIPLIISSGGNSGSQAATLIIRAMALQEITLKDWWMVMKREVLSGLMLGAVLGVIGFGRIALWSAFTNLYGPHWGLVAMTVAFSLVGVVVWGTLSGSMLPFVLRRLGFDPASSSAPFVATLVDVTGLVIYFTVAAIILGGTLLQG